jgi:Uri superfamily endonuclease
VKGSYILLAELASSRDILVGKLGYISFSKAFYAYVGSAMNGLEPRLARHLKDNNKSHWHIDYLLKEAKLMEIIVCPGDNKIECFLAQALAKEFQSIPNFGASDCKCQSHLYFAGEKSRLEAKVVEIAKQASLAYEILVPKERENVTDV